MSEIRMSVSVPLDEDGYLRRECSLCKMQFKILLTEKEKEDFTDNAVKNFMLNDDGINTEEEDAEEERICPYCGQKSDKNSWWTQEQVEYFNVFAKNYMTRILNEQFLKPLDNLVRNSGGLISKKSSSTRIDEQEPWISPEENDMDVFELPCCQRKLKIEMKQEGEVFCYFCGFPYKSTV